MAIRVFGVRVFLLFFPLTLNLALCTSCTVELDYTRLRLSGCLQFELYLLGTYYFEGSNIEHTLISNNQINFESS